MRGQKPCVWERCHSPLSDPASEPNRVRPVVSQLEKLSQVQTRVMSLSRGDSGCQSRVDLEKNREEVGGSEERQLFEYFYSQRNVVSTRTFLKMGKITTALFLLL